MAISTRINSGLHGMGQLRQEELYFQEQAQNATEKAKRETAIQRQRMGMMPIEQEYGVAVFRGSEQNEQTANAVPAVDKRLLLIKTGEM